MGNFGQIWLKLGQSSERAQLPNWKQSLVDSASNLDIGAEKT